MAENWCALFICIVKDKEISIDRGLTLAGVHRKKTSDCKSENQKKSKYSSQFVSNVLNLRELGKSYKEIGELLGLTRDQAWGVMKMYKKKIATRTPASSPSSL